MNDSKTTVHPATYLLLLMLCIFPALCTAETREYTLFKSRVTNYRIVCPPNASPSEVYAAKELKSMIYKVGRCNIIISRSLSFPGPAIYVGWSDSVKSKAGIAEAPAEDDESFRYFSKGADIFIIGGSRRGTMYGAFSFLERELGVRWYAPDCTKADRMLSYSFTTLDHSEKPFIGYRYNNYYVSETNQEWTAHNRENMKWAAHDNDYGGFTGYNQAHTMGQFMPAEEFFASHPEYFALRGGKRIRNGQLCLSNSNVLKICTARLLQRIHDEPGYFCYSLSQNDNELYCECDNCKSLENKYGGHSGLIVWFVNQAADEVKKQYPDKYVGTFAYRYTRTPPTGIVPKDNVIIRLCSIECCFAHPMRSCTRNTSFISDMRKWKQIAKHLFIWDYIVDYAQYMAPWPNFQVLAENVKLFGQNNAIGVFEEAAYNAPVTEFQEMKGYVTDRLLWDPYQNTDSLVSGFIKEYYGVAAPEIWRYYSLCKSLVKPNTHFNIYIRSNDGLYTDDFIDKGKEILYAALYKAGSDNILKSRVEKVLLQVLFLECDRNLEKAGKDGAWAQFRMLAQRYGLILNEGSSLKTLNDYIASGDVTGITQVTAKPAAQSSCRCVYDTGGELIGKDIPLSSLSPGIYIRGGKKILVK